MSLPRYPEYQDSGVKWLGEIPAHWSLRRVKSLSIVKRGASPRPIADPRFFSEDGDYGWVRISDVTRANNKYLKATRQKLSLLGKSKSVPLEPGALFLSIAGSVGKPIITAIRCCIHDGFVYFPEFKGNVEFLYYVFTSGAPYGGLGKLGTQLNLNTDTVGNISIGFPPPDEQAEIVRFLDAAEYRIRRYIRAKQKLIKLLTEQKQAIIQHAVTKGLDPDAPMQDSGIEWLGAIPSHWEVKRVKQVFDCFNRIRIPLSSVERGNMSLGLYDYYGASGVIDKVDDYLFDGAYLLIAEDGANLVLRNLPLAIIARGKFWVNNHAHILKPKNGSLEFLANLMELVDYRPWISGAAQPKLTQDRLLDIGIPVPPPQEQKLIAEYIEINTYQQKNTILNFRKQIELMQEYRTRLIADVVTGKIDVGGLAFEMPPEFDDLDLDEDDLIDDEDEFLDDEFEED